jgi:hypothetical protein
MVLVASRASGHSLPRAERTRDADVVVDVCGEPRMMANVVGQLESFGYQIPAEAWKREDLARCTFFGGLAQIDVLCPDDAREDELLFDDRIRSVAIPGGRRALELAEPVRIQFSDEYPDLEIRVPMLSGAILVKASNMVDRRTASQPRHFEDVAGMLSILDEPKVARGSLADVDVSLLRRISEQVLDDRNLNWSGFETETRLKAQAALAILIEV